jgi:hypothetical protein
MNFGKEKKKIVSKCQKKRKKHQRSHIYSKKVIGRKINRPKKMSLPLLLFYQFNLKKLFLDQIVLATLIFFQILEEEHKQAAKMLQCSQ